MSEIKLICGDCKEELKNLDSGCIDLTVTSPPYDNLREYLLDKFVVWRYTVSYEDKQRIIKELQEIGVNPVSTSK